MAKAAQTETPSPDAPSIAQLSPDVMAMVQAMAASMVAAQLEGAKQMQAMNGPRDNPMGSPQVSALNPAGERDNPRPELVCTTIFAGAEQEREACSVEELTLLNLIEQGRYRVQKTDGSYAVMTVYNEMDSASDRPVKKHIVLPGIKDQTGLGRQNWPSMLTLLAQAMGLPVPQMAAHAEKPLGRLEGASAALANLPTNAALGGKYGVSLDGSHEAFLAGEKNPIIKRDVAAFLGAEA
jgi:hypothetical protein